MATSGWVAKLFTPNEEVARIGAILLCIVALNEPIFGIAVVMEGVFNGIGCTKLTFKVSACTLWIVRVLGTFVAIKVFHWGIYGAWLFMILENTTRGIAFIISY